MTSQEADNLDLVRAYLKAVADFAAGDALARFYAPGAVQTEFPNRLNPAGGQSDLRTLLQRAEKATTLLSRQHYEVLSETAQDDRVAVEAIWTGVLAVPLGTLAAGAHMKAHFAMFFEMRLGRIMAQRNYDCFEPW